MERPEALRRALLVDRLDGLLFDRQDNDPTTWTPLHCDLSSVLTELVAGTARVHRDEAGDVVADLRAIIHDLVIERSAGLTR